MRCKLFLTFLLPAAFILPGHAQQNSFNQNLASNSILMFDANGKPFVNSDADATGSPFFNAAWKYGTVILTNNAVYSKRKLRINFQSKEIHYLAENNVEMALPAGLAKEVDLIDSAQIPVASYKFISGLPRIYDHDYKDLYLVLADGKLKMLQLITKNIVTEKNDYTGEINKEYRSYEDYYLFTGSVIERLKKDKTYLLGMLKDKKAMVEKYVSENKLNYKLIPDIKKIIEYYNTL